MNWIHEFFLWIGLPDKRHWVLLPGGTTVTDSLSGSIWICVEPELRLCLMKLYSIDNYYTMFLQGLLHPKKPCITDLWKFLSIESQIHASVRKVVNISGHCYMMPKRDLLKARKTKWLANFTCIDLKWI